MYLSSLRNSYLDRFLNSMHLDPHAPGTITDKARLRDELEATRKRGFSTDNEEFMEGMAAVAVPIHDEQRRLVSTLSVHAPLQRLGLPELVGRVTTLQSAAAELSELINS